MLRAVVTVAIAAAAAPTSASAALSFAFDRAEAHRGQLVHAFQADADGNPVKAWGSFNPASVTVYLVRLRDPQGWRFRIGPMRVDRRGVWMVGFRVPRVRAGLYTTAFFCRPCGNTFFASTLPDDQWTAKPSRVLRIRASTRR
jgi:hypothetical protein